MFAAFEWFTNNILWGLPLLLLCGGLGLYLTIGSGFFQFRAFGKIIKLISSTLPDMWILIMK